MYCLWVLGLVIELVDLKGVHIKFDIKFRKGKISPP